MSGYLMGGVLAAVLALQPGTALAASPAQAAAPKDSAKELRLNGCIARDKGLPGDFTFLETESSEKFRLTGKGLKDFVGHRVEIVGGPPGKRVTFRTSL